MTCYADFQPNPPYFITTSQIPASVQPGSVHVGNSTGLAPRPPWSCGRPSEDFLSLEGPLGDSPCDVYTWWGGGLPSAKAPLSQIFSRQSPRPLPPLHSPDLGGGGEVG